jgi:hypothetical protein
MWGLEGRGGLGLTQAERVVLMGGPDYYYEISYAIDADGKMPAQEALRQMSEGIWTEDPEVDAFKLPNDAQINDYAYMLQEMEFFAEYGYTSGGKFRINVLVRGLWEFKEGFKRLSFYDTDGEGHCNPKWWQAEPGHWNQDPGSDIDLAPVLDYELRVGHCFGKPPQTQKTEESDKKQALKIMEEDLAHDRT